MPKDIELFNHHMDCFTGTEIDESGSEPSAVPIWQFVFTDRMTGDRIRIKFREEARDQMIQRLQQGAVTIYRPEDLPSI